MSVFPSFYDELVVVIFVYIISLHKYLTASLTGAVSAEDGGFG